MMKRYKKFQRLIATFFLLIFFPTLFPTSIFATNNGPSSFEAANFEPVDATDMVNLSTGDMSYVMPLLNVPNPEGGYPLALSYHAGIALDQEASWTGLGWGLNPGAINRNVNGYPDDMGVDTEKIFMYDQGEQLSSYSIGVGATIYGLSVGVGAYWGSNKTLGGSVSLGAGPASISVGGGTKGTEIGVGYSKGLNDPMSNNSNDVSLKTLKKQSGDGSQAGTGISQSSLNFSHNDYNINETLKGVNISYFVNFYYGNKKVDYSLYSEKISTSTGIFNQNIISPPTNYYNANEKDVNRMIMYNSSVGNIIDVYNSEINSVSDESYLPNYDNYRVQAQGLFGIMSPSTINEFALLTMNYNPASLWAQGFQANDMTIALNNKLFFEFENTNSSYLRIDRTIINRNTSAENSDQSINGADAKAFKHAYTNNSNIFNENVTPGNIPLKNNNRKRSGKYIEAFTNQDILINGSTLNFVEAKNLNRSQPAIYKPEAIGGYRITDVDGKVYHYSLPVLNYEKWYKNYGDGNNEDANFGLIETLEPYATDWLLTAVTGADYVDINNNKMVDSADYGYWVEFDYGKWTDGYIWKSTPKIVKGDGISNDRQEFYRGRKQIYYLDAVRTRTHTAYFIKSLRDDAKGHRFAQWNSYASNGGGFNYSSPHSYSAPELVYNSNPSPGYASEYPYLNKNFYGLNSISPSLIRGIKRNQVYADFPAHYSLKLDKILLVKNSSLTINKNAGADLLANKNAFLYENSSFEVLFTEPGGQNYNGVYFNNPTATLKNIDIHQSSKVIDINDIAGININASAEKIIDFGYDNTYPLMKNSPNTSNNGKLTLQSVNFLGRQGNAYMPKYEFKYNMPGYSYNKNNEDGWGYDKNFPDAWSLNEITTPLGSKIKVSYEPDDFGKAFAKASRVFRSGLRFKITNSLPGYIQFEVSKNSDGGDVVNELAKFSDFFSMEEKMNLDMFICRRSKYGGHRRCVTMDINNAPGDVTYVDDNKVIFKIPDASVTWATDEDGDQTPYWILNRSFALTSVKHLDGSNDGVIITNVGFRTCSEWADQYDDDEVNFHYKLTSSSSPGSGKGGGIRVKEISVVDGANVVKNSTKYFYNLRGFSKDPANSNYRSSGVTSFAPTKEFAILPYASELPPPVIVYKNVSVEELGSTTTPISTTNYEFETLDAVGAAMGATANTIYSLGDKIHIDKIQSTAPFPQLKFTKYAIKNKLANIGRLRSVKNYNSSNQLLSSYSNDYYVFQDVDGELGVNQESYLSKSLRNNILRVNSLSEVTYPSRLASSTYITGGKSSKVNYLSYDFLTGEVTEQSVTSSDGKSLKTKIIPAYLKYPQMGSKLDAITNRNMLSQTAAEYSYQRDAAGNDRVTGVGITTWSNIWSYKDIGGATTSPTLDKEKIWRKHKSYTWNGVVDTDGYFPTTYNSATDDGFVWGVGLPQTNTNWKQLSEVTLYDNYSVALEAKDINGNNASTKMGDNDTKIIATGNAGYNEMFYAGAENIMHNFWLEPEVRLQAGARNSLYAHTGKYSVETTSGTEFGVFMRNGEHKAGKYKLSVWIHKDNVANARLRVWNNSNLLSFSNETYTAGDWVLKTAYLQITTGDYYPFLNSADGSKVYYDDLMIRPVASSITGYVYNEWDELTYIIGDNGLATKFEYDAAGRLIKTYVEVVDDPSNGLPTGGFKLKSQNRYNYKNL